MGFLGIEIGPGIDSLSNDFVSSHINVDINNYSGTLADLTALETHLVNECADYVHSENSLHNRANAQASCEPKIRSYFAPLVDKLQAQAAQQDAALQNTLTAPNTTLYVGAAITVIVLIALVLFLKS